MLATRAAQLEHALDEVVRRHGVGQPVLVGTRSVAASERFSRLLAARGIPHNLLNARHDAEEAGIVARAGRPGAITVATNMAGRGTDIPLQGAARGLGGLHVINLEANESRRVDRQLFGRSGRQGDPGSAQATILEDELVLSTWPKAVLQFVAAALTRLPAGGYWLARWTVSAAQRRWERRHKNERMRMFQGSEALERQLAIGGDVD